MPLTIISMSLSYSLPQTSHRFIILLCSLVAKTRFGESSLLPFAPEVLFGPFHHPVMLGLSNPLLGQFLRIGLFVAWLHFTDLVAGRTRRWIPSFGFRQHFCRGLCRN